MNERCELTEGEIEELKIELLDMEGILSNKKIELTSITEILAEVSYCRYSLIPYWQRSVTVGLASFPTGRGQLL